MGVFMKGGSKTIKETERVGKYMQMDEFTRVSGRMIYKMEKE